MKVILAMTLLLVPPALAAEPQPPPSGHWRNMDLRGIEVLQDGACVRLWLEERTYDLVPQSATRLLGYYSNIIRANPVGTASLSPNCKFPAPAEQPLSIQTRSWTLAGHRTSDDAWSIQANPAPGMGNMQAFKTVDFETTLTRSAAVLLDAPQGSRDPNQTLVFKAPGPPPAAARSTLEDTLRRLHNGECFAVQSQLMPSQEAVQAACELRQRMAAIAGRFLAIDIDSQDEFDRVPVGFPKLPSKNFLRQHGVFFSFTARYEKQQILCNAIVVEEADRWNVDVLWC